MSEMPTPVNFTEAAASKVSGLIEDEGNPDLKLRVYITGGGCSGFQYGFTFDESQAEDDTVVEKEGVKLMIDPMSFQYLVGAKSITLKIFKAHDLSSRTRMPPQPVAAVHRSVFKIR